MEYIGQEWFRFGLPANAVEANHINTMKVIILLAMRPIIQPSSFAAKLTEKYYLRVGYIPATDSMPSHQSDYFTLSPPLKEKHSWDW